MPGGRADQPRCPLLLPPVGDRAHAEHLHAVLHGLQSAHGHAHAQAAPRHRPREHGRQRPVDLRQGALRQRVGQRRGPAYHAARAQEWRVDAGAVGRGAGPGRREVAGHQAAARRRRHRRHRQRQALQREQLPAPALHAPVDRHQQRRPPRRRRRGGAAHGSARPGRRHEAAVRPRPQARRHHARRHRPQRGTAGARPASQAGGAPRQGEAGHRPPAPDRADALRRPVPPGQPRHGDDAGQWPAARRHRRQGRDQIRGAQADIGRQRPPGRPPVRRQVRRSTQGRRCAGRRAEPADYLRPHGRPRRVWRGAAPGTDKPGALPRQTGEPGLCRAGGQQPGRARHGRAARSPARPGCARRHYGQRVARQAVELLATRAPRQELQADARRRRRHGQGALRHGRQPGQRTAGLGRQAGQARFPRRAGVVPDRDRGPG